MFSFSSRLYLLVRCWRLIRFTFRPARNEFGHVPCDDENADNLRIEKKEKNMIKKVNKTKIERTSFETQTPTIQTRFFRYYRTHKFPDRISVRVVPLRCLPVRGLDVFLLLRTVSYSLYLVFDLRFSIKPRGPKAIRSCVFPYTPRSLHGTGPNIFLEIFLSRLSASSPKVCWDLKMDILQHSNIRAPRR